MGAVIRVFLVRHGESESGAGLPSADPASAPLTTDGRRQARQVARALAEAPALIATSPYLRARQTARPMISRYPAAARQEWPVQEFTYLGELHGRATTAREREPYARAYWDRADPDAASHGAESFAGLLGRVTDFLSQRRLLRRKVVAARVPEDEDRAAAFQPCRRGLSRPAPRAASILTQPG